MKNLRIIIPSLLFTFLISCSKNNDEITNPENITTPSNNSSTNNIPTTKHFNLVYDGQPKSITAVRGFRNDDYFTVSGTDSENKFSILFEFNKYGNLIESRISPTNSNNGYTYLYTFFYNHKNSFKINIININDTEKTVTLSYSGKLFQNPLNFSPTALGKNISGSFKVNYTQCPYRIPGRGVTAKIDDSNWYGTTIGKLQENGTTITTHYNKSDDEYSFYIIYPQTNPAAGTYNFTNNTTNNRFVLLKYDSNAQREIEYNVSGTIKYTAANSTYVQGTFNGIARHPSNGSTINITNGTFKLPK